MNGARTWNVVETFSPRVIHMLAASMAYPIHIQRSHELFFVDSGTAELYIGGHLATLQTGDLAFIRSHVTHGHICAVESRTLSVGIDAGAAPDFSLFMRDIDCPFLVLRHAVNNESICSALRKMIDEQNRLRTTVSIISKVSTALGEISSIAEHAEIMPCIDADSPMARLAQIVYDKLGDHIPNLSEIAQAANLSDAYASRIFRKLFGISFKDYTTLVSISAARRLLTQSNRPIREVAELCHYQSMRTFSRQFREIAGCTPTEYRARYLSLQMGDFDAPRLRPALERTMRELAATCPQAPVYEIR